MSGDRLARATAAAVLLVASIAAVVSFVHIQRLAVTHGQTALAAYLLPVSVDGTIAAASLVMLRPARAGLSRAQCSGWRSSPPSPRTSPTASRTG